LDPNNVDQKIAFEWRLRQMNFEVFYSLYRYSFDVDNQSFTKNVQVKVTGYFNFF